MLKTEIPRKTVYRLSIYQRCLQRLKENKVETVSSEALAKVESYVEIGRREHAELVTGGRRPKGAARAHGWFYEPTIFAGVRPGSRLEQEEIFGPVLSVVRVGSLDEAIRINNGVRYGLSSSLYTRDVHNAFRAMQDLDNGITYINAPTIGAEAHLPFGGTKETGNGHREAGIAALDVFSEWKSIYVDYSGSLQRASRLRRAFRTGEGQASIGTGACCSPLGRRALGERCQLLGRRPFAIRPAANDLDVYRNAVERIAQLVACPPENLTNRFRSFRTLSPCFSHSNPHHLALLQRRRDRDAAAACVGRLACRNGRTRRGG